MLPGPVLLCKRADSTLVSLVSIKSHLCEFAFHTALKLPSSDAQQVCPGHSTCFVAQCCSAKTGHNSLVSTQSHMCKSASHTALKVPNSDAQQVCPGHSTCFLAQCWFAETGHNSLGSIQSHLCKSTFHTALQCMGLLSHLSVFRPVCTSSIHRCNCRDTRLLSGCCVGQQWLSGLTFSLKKVLHCVQL